ncbi:alpha/beta hydrolase family protein [Polyangium mundeleinium]|uniref:Alpha/beta hydrolase n=1 Tax=Polyangium mundeleinium TaxID=2995306 RepID=A0ABT5ESW6_9BACT|nr:alpha/beta hydrolase [Polyangium mundeleinium]MDC0744917.1 alpha/beta hydrolase [Polyangium mundeleinium]
MRSPRPCLRDARRRVGLVVSLVLLAGCAGPEASKPPEPAASSGAGGPPTGPARLSYGPDPSQIGDLRLPNGEGPHPVMVILHGGCWSSGYGKDLMDGMSESLTKAGFATWNVEYRRLGHAGGGYPGTLTDVGLAVDALRELAPTHHLDTTKVYTVGHSAGGHLAVWVAARPRLAMENPLRGADPLPVAGVVALAGILDLAESVDLGVCGGAAAKLLGGSPSDVPARYAEASPRALLPLGVRQILVHGADDSIVPLVTSSHYQDAAKVAGEKNITLKVVEGGDHFDMIEPSSTKWADVSQAIVGVAALP